MKNIETGSKWLQVFYGLEVFLLDSIVFSALFNAP